ncbi:MAG: nitroreductase [Flavobacteriales bacterium]|nr:nitroreductase [Flavobacteriales bacterium]|tara:strand:- start:102766 stop:103332 length:567 start_codon:yes stop_codon:yes gene_type:complete
MNVREAIEKRWSPRAFSDEQVDRKIVKELFKLGGKAPSAFNEQPWTYLVGFKGDKSYDLIFESLGEFNQNWTKTAPVLMIGVVRKAFNKNSTPNAHDRHDLGQATAYMTLAALEHDIYLHQMGGFSADKARELFDIPEEFEAVTAIAMGYVGDKNQLPKDLAEQESPESPRKAIEEFVFEEKWNQAIK